MLPCIKTLQSVNTKHSQNTLKNLVVYEKMAKHQDFKQEPQVLAVSSLLTIRLS